MERRVDIAKKVKLGCLALVATLALFVAAPMTAHAATVCIPGIPCDPTCISCRTCVQSEHELTQAIIRAEHENQRQLVWGTSAGILPFPQVPNPPGTRWFGMMRLQHHERWLIEVYFKKHILPALMMMTEQLSSVMMEQMMIVGSYFDAKQQLETQFTFQKLAARAHKDYHPDMGMCEFGTNTRSLAGADFNGDFTAMVLNKRFIDRQVGNAGSMGAGGPQQERASADISVSPTPYNRLGYFLKNTCDDNDLNKVAAAAAGRTGLFICTSDSPREGWVNRDVDWNNTVMSPRTLNVDFERDTSDNSRVFEMANYLYGHKVFSRPDGTLLETQKNQDNFLDSRAVTAKRSVAQNSFDAIVGLKARGTHREDPGNPREISSENTSEHMRFFLVELGFPMDDLNMYHKYMFHKNDKKNEKGMDPEQDQISYYGQMEMLAKKVYQRPEFYTELQDKPANVKRKAAAMQAIKLMLDRDIFDSQLRSEAIMSMILELKVTEEQQRIENKLGLVKERTR